MDFTRNRLISQWIALDHYSIVPRSTIPEFGVSPVRIFPGRNSDRSAIPLVQGAPNRCGLCQVRTERGCGTRREGEDDDSPKPTPDVPKGRVVREGGESCI